jgi:superfamily II DNA or RNA helicase
MEDQKIILESSLLVPAGLVPLDALKKFTVTIKDSDGEPQNFNFYDYDHITGYYKFARGNLKLVYDTFGSFGIEDRRVVTPMDSTRLPTSQGYGIQFTGQLRDNQKEVANFVMGHAGYGQINAPPRFGKTITMTYLTCKFQMKTLFLAHEISLSQQALKTFYKYTNIIDLEAQEGRQIVGIVNEWEDLDKYDVAFMPYQKFVSGTDAEAQLKKYSNRFGVVWVDESHIGSRDWYAKIIGSFNSRVRMGVSGTTERKNNMHLVTNFVLGPVVIEGKSEQIPCEVTTIKTGVKVPTSPRNVKWFWAKSKPWLAAHKPRNEMIAKMIADYVNAGHSCVAVTPFSTHCEEVVQILKIKYGIAAEAYHAKKFKASNKEKSAKLREDALIRLRTGQTKVMVAVRSMVLGLDIPRMTAFFSMIPTANGPDYYQEYCRVRTPFEDPETGYVKQMGYIVDFVDDQYLIENTYKTRVNLYNKENFRVTEHKISL